MKRYTIQETDIDLLRNAGVSEDDIAHSVKVAEKALEIAYEATKPSMVVVMCSSICFSLFSTVLFRNSLLFKS
jgi:hypothetical protein